MLEALYAAQELQDLLRTQDNRQLLRLLGRRDNFFQAPILMKRDFVEKAKSGYGDEDFSAVARKYFHEIPPAVQEEVDLELFEQPRQVEQSAISTEVDAPVAEASNNQAESAKAEMSPPAPEPVESEAMPKIQVLGSPAEIASEAEKERPDLQSESAATPEITTPAEPEEAADVMPTHRGFFDRLLRRGSEH